MKLYCTTAVLCLLLQCNPILAFKVFDYDFGEWSGYTEYGDSIEKYGNVIAKDYVEKYYNIVEQYCIKENEKYLSDPRYKNKNNKDIGSDSSVSIKGDSSSDVCMAGDRNCETAQFEANAPKHANKEGKPRYYLLCLFCNVIDSVVICIP